MRKVCVLYTGGTVGTRHLNQELHPGEPPMLDPDEVERLLGDRSHLEDLRDVDFDFVKFRRPSGEPFQPIVSSAIVPRDWADVAQQISALYDSYDGFVVLHGTDTMAWTASALSFMFANLGKPVVLTGSQRPITATPSDAIPNFVNSVLLAAGGPHIPPLTEVVVCFGGDVVRGNRAQKVSAASQHGFDSPNYPKLGRIGRTIEIDSTRLRPSPPVFDAFHVNASTNAAVADIMIYPGMSASQLLRCLEGSDAAILRTYGAGNVPRELAAVLHRADLANKVLLNITQCAEGTVESRMLSGSNALADAGVMSGLDLTNEAALTKLMVLLGRMPPEMAREQVQLDLRGEQSMDLLEMTSEEGGPDLSTHRFVLSTALHARANMDHLTSAVLRLDGVAASDSGDDSLLVEPCLNDWAADGFPHDARADPRRIGRRCIAGTAKRVPTSLVFDVTETVGRVLEPGEPVTMSLVCSEAVRRPRVRLSIVTRRRSAGA